MKNIYEENKQELTELVKKIEYLKCTLNSLLYWDKITHMPPGGIEYRSQIMGFLGEELYRLMASDRLKRLIAALTGDSRNDRIMTATIRKLSRNAMYVAGIPQEEYADYIQLVANAEQVWETARSEHNFLLIQPYLERLIAHYRKFPEYWGYETNPYDAWLGYYEEGFDCATMDRLTEMVKPAILGLLKQIREKEGAESDGVDYKEEGETEEKEETEEKGKKGEEEKKQGGPGGSTAIFSTLPPVDSDVQMRITKKLLGTAGFSFQNGRVDFGAHPTILSSSPMDVRLVTSFQQDIRSGIFNAMYLAGKGLYEQDIDRELLGTMLAEVSSFALEEGVGRLYENGIGRSRAFWDYFTPLLQEDVPSLVKHKSEELFREVNRVNLTPVRLDADELTYMLHIIIRYELERELMDGTLSVQELPEAWNAKYREYLSLEPNHNGEGVLQDIHWFAGYFGYFASYLLSGLISAQFAHQIEVDTANFNTASAEERFSMIHSWLKERVFRFGGSYTTAELVELACGEPLNGNYFVEYLNKRFSQAYHLD